MPTDLVFLGAPGAGKGTQAQILHDHYGYRQLSTGEILRENRDRKTPLGLEAEAYMSRGELVPDELIIKMVEEALPEKAWVIFDGFPRTIPQARALDEMLQLRGRGLPHAICFRIELPAAEKRLLGRGREDDVASTIKRRFQVFEEHRQELESYYNNPHSRRFIEINGSQAVEKVADDLRRALESTLAASPIQP
jgi:adenylate kinase